MDTGQTEPLNINIIAQNVKIEKEPGKSINNTVQNLQISYNEDSAARSNKNDKVLGINFRIEINCKNDLDDQDIIVTSCDKVVKLLIR